MHSESRQVKFKRLFEANWDKMKKKFSWFGSQMTRKQARKIARDLARQGKEFNS